MKNYISILFMVGFSTICFAQITFNGCHPLFDDQDFIFTEISTDATGRNVFETIPIDGNQPCSGVGICEFRISWNNVENRWEFIADDGTGDFSSPFLIYTNSEASTPNPPSLNLGTWVENASVTSGDCGGDLTTTNATLTGDVQDTTLGVDVLGLESRVMLYPNPANEIIHINHKGYDIDNVAIYNVIGKLVLDAKVSRSIDVSKFNSGLYFVRIRIENQELVKKLLIK
ncbi:T9SS type A sorting domain-containing protein [Hwangdonia lutea]|uniref:T9SS type A sorting domain-containing protein n=1 Tax=Hwangdonia lutea TaxID=3075823 RepID=A0AA97HPP4_9FLAO|nr:T9SS type A sorting domain-containing protein [Hwangdonia sp. SCSIO 19198]WOD42075.1 T9SS type A sorting domain-containing protein [Hwangdonia sp. SCSIO 19198]